MKLIANIYENAIHETKIACLELSTVPRIWKIIFNKFIAKLGLLEFKPHFRKEMILQGANTFPTSPKSTRLIHNSIHHFHVWWKR